LRASGPRQDLIVERAVFIPDLERMPPPGQPYDRLYLGSESCVWRLPSERELHAALAVATQRGLSFSLVTPFLDEPGLTQTLALVRALPGDPAIEVVANDLGLMESLRASGWNGTLVAGRLLTRQRRGPGFQSCTDVPAAAAAALRGSALDAPAYSELLGKRFGVQRFELDDLVQGLGAPAPTAGVHLSLYRPYLIVTATRNCPWIFDGRTWDRSQGCGRLCRGQSLRLVSAAAQFAHRPPEIQDDESTLPGRAGERDTRELPRCDHGKGEAVAQSGGRQRRTVKERDGGPQREDPAVPDGYSPFTGHQDRPLLLGGCAQFLEHHGTASPPAGVDRIVWQPRIPA